MHRTWYFHLEANVINELLIQNIIFQIITELLNYVKILRESGEITMKSIPKPIIMKVNTYM